MKRACVIGWPVAHSRSPAVHTYWLRHYGLEGDYTKEAVPPEEIDAFLADLGKRGYAGANVTLPHKAAALAAADEVDEAARAIGAANTLWLDSQGRLHATNTDAYGFMTHLAEEAPGWNDAKRAVMVLGGGGAARAIVHGLIAAGASKVVLANRTRSHAETLARDFGPKFKVRGAASSPKWYRSPMAGLAWSRSTATGVRSCWSTRAARRSAALRADSRRIPPASTSCAGMTSHVWRSPPAESPNGWSYRRPRPRTASPC